MSGLRECYKEPYSQQAGCIISLALSRCECVTVPLSHVRFPNCGPPQELAVGAWCDCWLVILGQAK